MRIRTAPAVRSFDVTGPPPAAGPPGRTPARLWPLYLGGFLGPFAAAVVNPMLPEISADLNISLTSAGAVVSAYLLPFAGLLFVSGSIADRLGRRRALVGAYAAFVLASIALTFAPDLGTVVALRAVQGAANAFITPVLVSMLADLVPAPRLGRTLGILGSLQAAGQAFAPLLGGVAASIGWRYAFLGTALAAGILLLATPVRTAVPPAPSGSAPTNRTRRRSPIRPAVLNGDVVRAALVAGTSYLTVLGIQVIGALWVSAEFGAGPIERGLIIAVYGVTGLLAGSVVGRGLDRFGTRLAGSLYAAGLALAALAFALPGLPIALAALALGGAAGTGLRTATNLLAVRAAPENRSGAVSVVLAVQFLGGALAPVLWLPVYGRLGGVTLAVCAVGAVVAAGLLITGRPARATPA